MVLLFTSSDSCFAMIRALSRAAYAPRDKARRRFMLRDTTRAQLGNRTAASHDSGSKQIARNGSAATCLRVTSRTVHAHECQLVTGRHCYDSVFVTKHARVLVRRSLFSTANHSFSLQGVQLLHGPPRLLHGRVDWSQMASRYVTQQISSL